MFLSLMLSALHWNRLILFTLDLCSGTTVGIWGTFIMQKCQWFSFSASWNELLCLNSMVCKDIIACELGLSEWFHL